MKSLGDELTEKDALYRIKWDSGLAASDYSVEFVDRKAEGLRKVDFTDIELMGDYFSVGDSLIPLHRVRRISCRGVVVWDRRKI